MEYCKWFFAGYLILSSTVGAYYFAKTDQRFEKEDVTLFHVVGNIFPAIILSVPFLMINLFTKIVIRKR